MVKTDDEEGQLASRAGEKQGVWQCQLPPSTVASAPSVWKDCLLPSASCSFEVGVVRVQHVFPGEAWPSCPARVPCSPGPRADSPALCRARGTTQHHPDCPGLQWELLGWLGGASCSQLRPGGVFSLQGLELSEPHAGPVAEEPDLEGGVPGLGLVPSKASWF